MERTGEDAADDVAVATLTHSHTLSPAFPNNLSKPVPEGQTILDFNAARNDANWNCRRAELQSAIYSPPLYGHHNNQLL